MATICIHALTNMDVISLKGARHTYASVAGRNVANPTAMLLAAVDMLDHLK